MASYRITGVKTLYAGWGRLLKLSVTMPDGRTMEREVEDHGAAVAVLPYDPEGRMALLVRQFRAPVLHVGGPSDLLEAPAGMLDEDDPADCARREAHEEVGLNLRALEPLGAAWPCPGISTERIHLFLAPYGPDDRVAAGGGLAEEHEDIEVVEMPLSELWTMVAQGEVLDLKTLFLVQALRIRRPDLFGARE
jgi:nudix-type nucleoside diphosphatase (YffH/AdpP family)